MKKHANYYLFFLVAFILGFSFLFFYVLSTPASMQRFNKPNYYFSHRLLFGLLPALVMGFVAYKISLKWLKKFAFWLVLFNIALLFAVFLPFIGTKIGGATRWFDLGFFSVQPAEFLKITAILYLSAWIASRLPESKVKGWKLTAERGYHNLIYIFLPFIIFLGLITVALYCQRDASTLGIISLTLLALYFYSRTPLWHTLFIVFSGLTFLLLIVKFEPYRLDRWLLFLHPDTDPLGKGFQLRQSLISLGSGGIFGQGLGMSTQKFGFLPQAMSDSIFAIIGEEFGLVGGIILIALFVLLFWLGIKIARDSNDRFSSLVAMGIVTWITLQAFVNIASVAGIFPLAGIPLPFFSQGGSHLVVELIGVGLLLNISKNT